MSKIFVQAMPDVLKSTASLDSSACVSGSLLCGGYARLVGGVVSNASSAAASGLRILQSMNGGTNWDVITASAAISACSGSSFGYEIVGDAVKVEYRNGATAASLFRTLWQLRPV